jgi:hypothetical protein
MKNSWKLIGILLLLLIAGNGCHNAHHRGTMGSSWMNKKKMGYNFSHNQITGPNSDSMMMRNMRPDWGMRRMDHMRQFTNHRKMFMMKRNLGQMNMNHHGNGIGQMPPDIMGRGPMGPGRMILESIPNVTEKQKKEIKDLMQNQQEEMKKLHDEMSAKMEAIRDSERDKMMNLLTDEQKKFIESGTGNPKPDSAKSK